MPADAIVGREGDGWQQVVAELGYERSGPERIYSSIVLLDAWVAHRARSGPISDESAALGRQARWRNSRRCASCRSPSPRLLEQGQSPTVEAALVKDLGTSFEQSIPALIGDDLASRPDEPIDPDLYRTLTYVTQVAPTFSLRGGTREILRGMIARELGLR